jgi:hypothetical protein
MLLAAGLLTCTGGAASAAADSPQFDPESTTVKLHDDAVTVTFVELGLPADATVQVKLTANVVRQAKCTAVDDPSKVVLSTSSSGEASVTDGYSADSAGRVSASRFVDVDSSGPNVSVPGWSCSSTRTTRVVLVDLTNGIEYFAYQVSA